METKKAWKIKNPDGEYKKEYLFSRVLNTSAHIITAARDIVLTDEDKAKIILIKGCVWEEVPVPVIVGAPNEIK